MLQLLLCSLLFASSASASVGKIIKVLGGQDAYILRLNEKIPATLDTELEENDEIHSQQSHLVLYLEPATQLSLARESVLKLTKNELQKGKELLKSESVVDLLKGIVRVQVTKEKGEAIEQKVRADQVTFSVRGTEFEVSVKGEEVDLDVIEGEVEASSPLVMTFVPEIIKSKEGFRFSRNKRKFARRKFALKFKDHPGFMRSQEVRKKWRERKKRIRERIKARRSERRKRRE